jgi:hypothetical protein
MCCRRALRAGWHEQRAHAVHPGRTAASHRERRAHAAFYRPVYVERTVPDLPAIYINRASRGFLVRLAPDAVARLLDAWPVEVAIPQ